MKTSTGIRSLLIITLFWSYGIKTNAQVVFKVLANKGSNQVRNKSEISWKPVKFGLGLQSEDIIKIGKNSYVGLVHSSGRMTELAEPGEIEISILANRMGEMKKGLPSKYSEFVFNTVISAEGVNETIGVRGDQTINVRLPGTSAIYGSNVLVSWSDGNEHSAYLVGIYDIFDGELMLYESIDEEIILDLSLPELSEEEIVVIKVFDKDRTVQSADHIISILPEARATAIGNELNTFVNTLDLSKPTDNILLGAFFEENQLLVDAIYYYHQAAAVSEIVDYGKFYEYFSDRNAFR